MRDYTLVVVDMQPNFVDASVKEELMSNVTQEIQLAIDCGAEIVFTEIPYFSALDEEALKPTFPELLELVKGYPRYRKVTKMPYFYSPHGAAETVLRHCDKREESKSFRVCGVYAGGWIRNSKDELEINSSTGLPNWTGCVFDIVLGLRKVIPDSAVQVVQDACRDTRKFMKQIHWSDFTGLGQVTLHCAGAL